MFDEQYDEVADLQRKLADMTRFAVGVQRQFALLIKGEPGLRRGLSSIAELRDAALEALDELDGLGHNDGLRARLREAIRNTESLRRDL